MGKKKQKKRSNISSSKNGNEMSRGKEDASKASSIVVKATPSNMGNPLLDRQSRFMEQKGLTDTERHEFFSPSIPSDRRAELWMAQADLGEDLVNRYAWATPNSTAIRILKEFSPLVEIGCGSNAYWCQILRKAGVDIVGYDVNISSGGLIEGTEGNSKTTKHKNKGDSTKHPSYLKQGGPDLLSSKELRESGRTLFLCYPDEDEGEDGPPMDSHHDDEEEMDEESASMPTSMGWLSLHHYSGEFVIHVGETFLDANYSMEQAPWGRSSASEFQQRLASEYHCLLKVELPNWFHTRDSISVWKRSTISTIVFAADEDEEEDDEDEEVEYRHIPRNERLPVNIAAPCLAHLLPESNSAKPPKLPPSSEKLSPASKAQPAKETKKRGRAVPEETPVRERTDQLGASNNNSNKEKKGKRSRHEEDRKNAASMNSKSYDWGELDDTEMTNGKGGKYVTPW